MHTGGKTYRLQSEVTGVSTDRSGRPTGRMFPRQQELRFDVHDLKLEHADYLFDYDEPGEVSLCLFCLNQALRTALKLRAISPSER